MTLIFELDKNKQRYVKHLGQKSIGHFVQKLLSRHTRSRIKTVLPHTLKMSVFPRILKRLGQNSKLS